MAPRFQREAYTVGWVCALPIELAAAQEMLDEEHEDLEQDENDSNLYSLGSIGGHKIVLACLPAGQTGTNSAAVVAMQMKATFKGIRFGLMVGIGGGVPSGEVDIRLGDVVVSQPVQALGGVVQYDFGKATPSGFKRTGSLNAPPPILLGAVAKMRANHLRRRNSLPKHVSKLSHIPEFARASAGPDMLFEATYDHVGGRICEMCSADQRVARQPREMEDVVIHYGTIASGNQVMRDGTTRDSLSAELGGVLCFEMEAAGLTNSFPCLVIRGICDYADSHKNKKWQAYAAGTAAACAKEVLLVIPPAEVAKTRTVQEAIEAISGRKNAFIRHQEEIYKRPRSFQLDNLPNISQAAFNSYMKQHEPTCLKDTRVEVLQEISNWAHGDDDRPIFWLNGLAGTGKSTIARTVARENYDNGYLGASFFFSRGGGDLGHAGKFFPTIAVQLAKRIPSLEGHICESLEKHDDVPRLALHDQWRLLIYTPLSRLENSFRQSRLVIVIDALDECEGENDVRALLKLLSEIRDITTVRFRVFITSRPETPLRLGFRQMPSILHHDLVLDHVPQELVNRDILTFFKQQFSEIRHIFENISPDWPGIERLTLLVQKSGGLFIYAATVCRFVKSNDQWLPDDLLGIFIPSDRAKKSRKRKRRMPTTSPFSELDKIYTQILDYSLKRIENPQDQADIAGEIREIISTLAVLFQPLSLVALGYILDTDHVTIHQRLKHLRSVLSLPDDESSPVRLLHPSFQDFLFDNERCVSHHFSVEEKVAHKRISEQCVNILSNSLKQDICNVNRSGMFVLDIERTKIQQALPLEVEYACTYWVQHVLSSGVELGDDCWVHGFLSRHILHWLEALSWIRKLSDGIHFLGDLESRITAKESPSLFELVHDAKRFVLYSRLAINQAPLQVYASALIFAPKNSIIRKKFEKQIPRWTKRLPETNEAWNATLQTLEGHSNWVSAVAFSPDGSVVASASGDGTVKLWDTRSGQEQQTLKVDLIFRSLSFSSNGCHLNTDRGVIDVMSRAGDMVPILPSTSPALFVKEQWVTRGTEHLLWIPPDYRATSVAVFGDIVVLGHASGRVSILEFEFSEKYWPPPRPPP